MPKRRWSYCVLLLALVLHLANTPGHADSSAPTFKITAQNVHLSGRGQAPSQYIITSVNGFAGKVSVVCSGPDPNLFPYLIMPSCAEPTQELTVPANGSIGGNMIFHPPWVDLTARNTRHSLHGSPLLVCGASGFGLLALRRRLHKSLTLVLAVVSLCLVVGAVGCGGSSGLQMTPGTYIFTLSGAGDGVTATGKVSVTVVCNTCP